MGPGHSSSLRIDGDSLAIAGSGRTGDIFNRSAGAEIRDAPKVPILPLDKGKGKVNLIKYPGGSEYLRSAVQHCDAPKPGGPLTTRQPAEYKWRSGYPTPH